MSGIDWKPFGPDVAPAFCARRPCDTCGQLHAVTFPRHDTVIISCRCGVRVHDPSGIRFMAA